MRSFVYLTRIMAAIITIMAWVVIITRLSDATVVMGRSLKKWRDARNKHTVAENDTDRTANYAGYGTTENQVIHV